MDKYINRPRKDPSPGDVVRKPTWERGDSSATVIRIVNDHIVECWIQDDYFRKSFFLFKIGDLKYVKKVSSEAFESIWDDTIDYRVRRALSEILMGERKAQEILGVTFEPGEAVLPEHTIDDLKSSLRELANINFPYPEGYRDGTETLS